MKPEQPLSIVASAIITDDSSKRTTEHQQNGNSSISTSLVHIAYALYGTISRLRKISVSRIVERCFLRFFQ